MLAMSDVAVAELSQVGSILLLFTERNHSVYMAINRHQHSRL